VKRRDAALQHLRSSPSYGDANPFRALRESFDITQTKAASMAGVSRALWVAWETKIRPISVHQLGAVVKAFGLSRGEIHWIVRWWEDARASPLTVAQLNVLKMDLPGHDLDVVDLLARLYELPPS